MELPQAQDTAPAALNASNERLRCPWQAVELQSVA
jgi:hypothetical protein